MHGNFELILLLMALAIGITAVAKKLNQPYPIALVIVGAVIGLVPIPGLEELKHFVAEDEVFRFAIISLFLPALLGDAAFKMPWSHLQANRQPVLLLAFLTTLLSFVIVGVTANLWLGLSLQVAFVFAALMAATDPVSVISIFKSQRVDHRLATVIEGESLLNDGIAVVLFQISAYYLVEYMAQGALGFALGGWMFVKVALGGAAIGAVLGYVFSQLTRLFDDYPLEILFSMLLFYGAFFLAESIHVSGVIAVVVAAIIFGNYGAAIGMSPTTKLNIRSFWDVTAQLANSLVFLMVGLEITRIDVLDRWWLIVAAILAVLVARAVGVYVALAFAKKFPGKWQHILNWGGLKGSLSIALALSLPLSFAGREVVLLLAFSVVLFSLVVQGLTVKPLIAWLGVRAEEAGMPEYEQAISEIQRCKAGLARLKGMKEEALISGVVYERLKQEYEERLRGSKAELEALYARHGELQEEQLELAREQALYSEYEAVQELAKRHVISDVTLEEEQERISDLLEEMRKEH
ncbi:sodium:proton antiporter [Tumebacillus avium]|uniref:Sodium:proton antiporter n=1 Tax=Tumebacillus avium TaxID=1903704 RepID=A0A1Y0IN36_9BACL|nr:cation:proton antiporter [Tumebacillus avium]ARU61992.1 sodium:proton antiporter [Tumebacillus avium]